MRGDFVEFDDENRRYRAHVPPERPAVLPPETSADEVVGWTAMFVSQNYAVAADRFEACWETARQASVLEMGAFHGWNLAKALYLQSLLGEAKARERSLEVFEHAVTRGGVSSWFNRMRASLNRARHAPNAAPMASDYAAVLLTDI